MDSENNRYGESRGLFAIMSFASWKVSMKSLVVMSSVIACVFVGSACMSEPPPATDVQSETTTDTAEIAVPAALQLQATPADVCGGVFKRVNVNFGGGCSVTLTCHDPNHGCVPTYCGNGGCGGTAPGKAVNMCLSNCSAATNCDISNMIQLPAGC
jgi:hypothetical protein